MLKTKRWFLKYTNGGNKMKGSGQSKSIGTAQRQGLLTAINPLQPMLYIPPDCLAI